MLRWKIIAAISWVVTVAIYFYASNQFDEVHERPYYSDEEKKFVDKTIKRYRKININMSAEDFEIYRYAVAITINNEVCVELKSVIGIIGEPIGYCWNATTEEMTRHFPKNLEEY